MGFLGLSLEIRLGHGGRQLPQEVYRFRPAIAGALSTVCPWHQMLLSAVVTVGRHCVLILFIILLSLFLNF